MKRLFAFLGMSVFGLTISVSPLIADWRDLGPLTAVTKKVDLASCSYRVALRLTSEISSSQQYYLPVEVSQQTDVIGRGPISMKFPLSLKEFGNLAQLTALDSKVSKQGKQWFETLFLKSSADDRPVAFGLALSENMLTVQGGAGASSDICPFGDPASCKLPNTSSFSLRLEAVVVKTTPIKGTPDSNAVGTFAPIFPDPVFIPRRTLAATSLPLNAGLFTLQEECARINPVL